MTLPVSHSTSFILRVWYEPGADQPLMRLYIQHPASGKDCYLDQMNDLGAFIRACAALQGMQGQGLSRQEMSPQARRREDTEHREDDEQRCKNYIQESK